MIWWKIDEDTSSCRRPTPLLNHLPASKLWRNITGKGGAVAMADFHSLIKDPKTPKCQKGSVDKTLGVSVSVWVPRYESVVSSSGRNQTQKHGKFICCSCFNCLSRSRELLPDISFWIWLKDFHLFTLWYCSNKLTNPNSNNISNQTQNFQQQTWKM